MISTTYALGDRGPAVAEIRERLQVLGLLKGDATDDVADLFDAELDTSVRIFQQQRSLLVDGVVGSVTFRTLEEARWRLGDRILHNQVHSHLAGDDVAQLQQRLTAMGFDSGRVDGIFGPRTEAALRDFQKNVGIAPDGTCGPSTFKALERLSRTVVGGSPLTLRAEEQFQANGFTPLGKVVVLDPGHGADHLGITRSSLTEAHVVADLAARIEGRLVATGMYVFLTRGKDGNHLTDRQRADFANSAGAQLCVSLHVDRDDNPSANGVATYYYGNDQFELFSPLGKRFAEQVQRHIVSATDLADCRSHAKTWDLLRLTTMPTVLIEAGYLTNDGDAERLSNPAFRDTVAEAISNAIVNMFTPQAAPAASEQPISVS